LAVEDSNTSGQLKHFPRLTSYLRENTNSETLLGVGKTLTAGKLSPPLESLLRLTDLIESIAELLERPLLALTCSDLGTAADEVGSALDTYLTLGELWGAVVLLDEADVYFEARGHSDVKRNSMVTGKILFPQTQHLRF